MGFLDSIKEKLLQLVTNTQPTSPTNDKLPVTQAEWEPVQPVCKAEAQPIEEATLICIKSSEARRGDTVDSIALRELLKELRVGKDLGKVVILGCNEGSWPKVLIDDGYTTEWIHSYLWRYGHELPALAFHHDRVQVKTEEIGVVTSYKCDTLLCNLNPMDNLQLELKNLKLLVNWLALRPERFIVRLVNYRREKLRPLLVKMKDSAGSGRLITVRDFCTGLDEVYFMHSFSKDSLMENRLTRLALSPRESSISRPRARWPVPSMLPKGVPYLAPLDMGESLKECGRMEMPLESKTPQRQFMKELGWQFHPFSSVSSMKNYRSSTFDAFVMPLKPLIIDFDQWMVTSNSPSNVERMIQMKIDRAPVENHPYIPHLWATYEAIAEYLRSQGSRIYKLEGEKLLAKAKRGSSMGKEGKKFDCLKMGEFLDKCDWEHEIAKFKEALLSGKPVMGFYDSFGIREVKNKDKLRVVQCLPAIGRLYETQVLGSFDELLYKLQYTTRKSKLHDNGEIFQRMLDQPTPRFAICDDISGWDTRVSYSMLCMESAFLQLLTDDAEHKKEIEHLYRLYAFSVVSYILPDKSYPPEAKKYVRVFYQLQGQVASGRRVTYSMNTTSNIVIQLVRAALSQRKPVNLWGMREWVSNLLNNYPNSYMFGGMMYGDDSVIIQGEREARESAQGRGIKFLNEIGFPRKKQNNEPADGPSEIVRDIDGVEFCNRKYVEVKFYDRGQAQPPFSFGHHDQCQAATRLMPIKSVSEILMRNLLREKATTKEFDLAWSRGQAKNLLVDFFHIHTIRILALAILSATPSNITLDEAHNGAAEVRFTEKPLITKDSVMKEINERYFGKGTRKQYQKDYTAKSLDDLGHISDANAKLYDLEQTSEIYQKWVKNLPEIIEKFRKKQNSNYIYENWIKIPHAPQTFEALEWLSYWIVVLLLVYLWFCCRESP